MFYYNGLMFNGLIMVYGLLDDFALILLIMDLGNYEILAMYECIL